MAARRRVLAGLLALPVLRACALPARPGDSIRQIIAPGGALRVALYTGTPTSVLSETDLRGVGYDLGLALAKRLDMACRPLIFPKNSDVLAAIKAGDADVAFTNASPERAKDMDFTQSYLVIPLGYLAAPKSAVSRLDGVDRPGMRVGVTANSSSDQVLSRQLQNARVVRAVTLEDGIELLKTGGIDLYATNKATLFEMMAKLPGAHILDGAWGEERHALGIPKGRAAGLGFLRGFVAEALRDGTVRKAVARAGLQGAMVPAA